MKNKTFISTEKVVPIRKFVEDYMELMYIERKRLSHKRLRDYLVKNNRPMIATFSIGEIPYDQIKSGRYVLVKEEAKKKGGKVLAYRNPMDLSRNAVLNEFSKQEIEQNRIECLKEMGYDIDVNGDVVEEDYKYDEYTVTVKIKRYNEISSSFHKK